MLNRGNGDPEPTSRSSGRTGASPSACVGATQLTGLRLCVATHFFGGVCVPCVVALDLQRFHITLVSLTVTG